MDDRKRRKYSVKTVGERIYIPLTRLIVLNQWPKCGCVHRSKFELLPCVLLYGLENYKFNFFDFFLKIVHNFKII